MSYQHYGASDTPLRRAKITSQGYGMAVVPDHRDGVEPLCDRRNLRQNYKVKMAKLQSKLQNVALRVPT